MPERLSGKRSMGLCRNAAAIALLAYLLGRALTASVRARVDARGGNDRRKARHDAVRATVG
jgi:hypothetical protein